MDLSSPKVWWLRMTTPASSERVAARSSRAESGGLAAQRVSVGRRPTDTGNPDYSELMMFNTRLAANTRPYRLPVRSSRIPSCTSRLTAVLAAW
jgi:hypothetical protein